MQQQPHVLSQDLCHTAAILGREVKGEMKDEVTEYVKWQQSMSCVHHDKVQLKNMASIAMERSLQASQTIATSS